MEINQFLPTISPRDAIGNEVIEIKKILTNWGYKSNIYAENIHPTIKARKYSEYSKGSSKDNIALFHFSIGSGISKYIKKLPEKKIIRYHGITPPQYFAGINQYIMELLRNGQEQLLEFPPITQLALANSRYTEVELQNMKFKNTAILPLIINYEVYKKNPNENFLSKYNDDYVNIIFTGRIIPQKRQEEIIKIFYYYQKINSKSRLFLIGSADDFKIYYYSLLELIKKLKVSNIIFTGSITDEERVGFYKLADIFLCMSEWETFCVPLVESMYFNIPIIANNATAIPNTLGDAGILINDNVDYCAIAELIDVIINNNTLKRRIIQKQRERLENFSYRSVTEQFKKIIDNLTDEV